MLHIRWRMFSSFLPILKFYCMSFFPQSFQCTIFSWWKFFGPSFLSFIQISNYSIIPRWYNRMFSWLSVSQNSTYFLNSELIRTRSITDIGFLLVWLPVVYKYHIICCLNGRFCNGMYYSTLDILHSDLSLLQTDC